jgi:putative protein-disulfide isomerase
MSRLVYVGDPMCSWCYGFGPQLSALLAAHPDAGVEMVTGGLRAYNTNPMTDEFREMLRGHWKGVEKMSGLPFSEGALLAEGFVYDTEPACRAVVTARAHSAERALPYFQAVQSAFYRDGRNVSRGEVLADIAAETGMERETFLAAWRSEVARDATRNDFSVTQKLGVSGFPTLAVYQGDALFLVASGYCTADVLEERLAAIAARTTEGKP